VAPGDTLDADLLEVKPGDIIELDKVLLISDGKGEVTVGTPIVPGARVLAQAVGTLRAKKVVVFKYKSKVRYRKKTGHRQHHTRMVIKGIIHSVATDRSEGETRGTQERRRQHKAGA
jgi:large subunit ribosomal protein L21